MIWLDITPKGAARGSDIKPYQPESRGIVCQGLNHPRARCSYCLIPQFNVFVQDLRDDMGDDMGDDMAGEG